MSDERPEPGTIGWIDLTVENADEVKEFYAQVVGWKPEEVPMGSYSDYNMTLPETGTPATGVCHRKGTNEAAPTGWMIYVNVAHIDESVAKVLELGGKVVMEPRDMGAMGRFCMIEDPSGAACALFEPA